jgi:regulator of replication initiation timing
LSNNLTELKDDRMNIKKTVFKQITDVLEMELNKTRAELGMNVRAINKLAYENKVLKKKRNELATLINTLKK